MTKEQLIERLTDCLAYDNEVGHSLADAALIAYINDPDIAEAYDAISKWYA